MNQSRGARDLAAAAGKLREVREAYQQFLTTWALEHITEDPRLLDRVAADVAQAGLERKLADPFNRDWSLLYRGNVLDD